MGQSAALFERAKNVIPGGVNSPVRAFGSIHRTPPFIKRADGAELFDEDGKQYIDYIGSWGPMILGHNHPVIREALAKALSDGVSFGAATKKEVEMAELICSIVPSVEMVRMVNSGTEAAMSAIRAARGFTKKDKIIKFAGCYHGHADCMLVRGGSGLMTAGVTDSAGVPDGATKDTIVVDYNDSDAVEQWLVREKGQVAAIIVEPVAANMGLVLPKEGFLQKLRELADAHDALLIFDEVITGFRLQADGAQGYFGIRPDLSVFGKIIGAGLPVGAYGGRADIMRCVAPAGNVYQAGTLSGNPLAMTAGLTLLRHLKNHPELYTELNAKADAFFQRMRETVKESGRALQVTNTGSLGCLFFTDREPRNYTDAKEADTEAFADYAGKMIESGIYLAPSQFEAIFLSAAHTKEQLEQTLSCMKEALLR